MAVPDSGCGGDRQGFSWQSQTMVVGGRNGGSYGSPIAGCVKGEARFSWQSKTIVVGGGEAGCFHGSPRRWLWEKVREPRYIGSHGSSRH